MSRNKELIELEQRKAFSLAMGGPDKVKRQHDKGKLTVRERIERFVDAGTFVEVGILAGQSEYNEDLTLKKVIPSNFIMGRAKVDGRPVVVVGDDFTVRGGSNEGAVGEKLIFAEQMAYDLCVPMVRLIDGTGGGGSVKNLEKKGYASLPQMKSWSYVARNLSRVPVVSLALGSVAGKGAARVAGSHYSVMVQETSQVFVAGPPIVAKLGQKVEKNELGGSTIHTRNGVVDDEAESEEHAFSRARKFLSYLPSSVQETAPTTDAPKHVPDQSWLVDAIPENSRKVYKIWPVLTTLFDEDSIFEIGKNWGKSIVSGVARIKGRAVAFAASNPYHYGGSWDRQTAEKFVRLVDVAELFRLPVVHLIDNPGFMVGLDAEKSAVMRAGVRALTAVSQTTVPWFSLIIRRAFGVGGGAHQNSNRFNFRYAWPSAQWGSLPFEGGLEVAYRAEIEAAKDPEAKHREIKARLESVVSPFRTAENFNVEDIIDPRETRERLVEFAELSAKLCQPREYMVGYRP